MPRERKLPPGLWRRGRTYFARFRAGGRLVRKRLSTDFDAACTLLNELRARADKADFDLLDNDYPFATLKAEFLKWASQSIRHPEDYEADLTRFEKFCRIRSVREISHAHMVNFREWRLAQTVGGREGARHITPRTVNREVGTVNSMLNKAVSWGRIGNNPIAGMKPLAHDRLIKNRRPLTAEEVVALFRHSPAYLRPVWRMFACTGIRHSELVELRFANFDFERRTVTITADRSKNHKAREIPLDDSILAMLIELRDQARHRRPVVGQTAELTAHHAARLSREHVFVTKANTPLSCNLLAKFYAICKRAGIDDAKPLGSVDIHSLRVTFTTASLENGANPRAVQAILGHSTLAMTMGVYAKATERSKRDAITALPWAAASCPGHIIPVQNAHRMRTIDSGELQPDNAKAVAQ